MTLADDSVFRFGDYILLNCRFNAEFDAECLARAVQPGMIGIVVSVPPRGPKSVSLRDLSMPLSDVEDGADLVIVGIPREKGPSWLLAPLLEEAARCSDHLGVRLLARHLTSLAEVAEGLSVPDGIVALEAALLLAAAVYQSDQVSAAGPEIEEDSRRKIDAIRLIDKWLMEPSLTIESLAVELGVSRATLFRDFGPDNGVKAYIRARRLALARRALLERAGRRPSIAEIAHAHGFNSESHFSRAYSLAYGHTPGSASAKADLPKSPSGPTEPPEAPASRPAAREKNQ